MSGRSVRTATTADLPGVLELRLRAGAQPTVTDTVQTLYQLLAIDRDAPLLAETAGQLAGSLIAAWTDGEAASTDSRFDPHWRRRGLATDLVREGECRLRERGARRVYAIVTEAEQSAMSFWRAAGDELQSDRARLVRNFRPRGDC
jgi:ribosomal protein S18 acetylase RimI-like enzyme